MIVLTRIVAQGLNPDSILVKDVMTKNRCRYLPVVTPAGILGMISIGDSHLLEFTRTKERSRLLAGLPLRQTGSLNWLLLAKGKHAHRVERT